MDLKARVHINCERKDGWTDRNRTPMSQPVSRCDHNENNTNAAVDHRSLIYYGIIGTQERVLVKMGIRAIEVLLFQELIVVDCNILHAW